MSASETLLEIYQGLSKGKREVVSAFRALENLLKQDRILDKLHKNSKGGDEDINWDILFIKAHRAIVSEVDRLHGKTFAKATKILFSEIIEKITDVSVYKCVPLINCNTIISNVLSILEADHRKVEFGGTYISMLQKYLISHKIHCGEVKNETWIALKDICKQMYHNSPDKISSKTFLEILTEVVRISSKNSVNLNELSDLFPFLKNIYLTERNPPQNLQIALLWFTNVLCRHLASEFRFQVCEFIEDIFDVAINFYDKKPDKNIHVFQFLALALSVHNPNGSDEKSCLSYAHDWNKWKKQIKEIYMTCHSELKEMHSRPPDPKAKDNPVFIDVFVDSTHLMIIFGMNQYETAIGSDGVDFGYSQPGVSNKRKRSHDFCSQSTPVSFKVSSVKMKQIKIDCSLKNVLQYLLTPEAGFWIKFLDTYLQKYPHQVRGEVREIVDILRQIFAIQTDEKIIKGVCRCFSVLLDIEENRHFELGDAKEANLSELWDDIVKLTLRSFRAHAFPEHYLLIKSLLDHHKIENPAQFLDLYPELLEPDLENFNLLLSICQNCVLPDAVDRENDHSDVRFRLLEWLGRDASKYPSKNVNKVLISFVLKRSEDGDELRIIQNDRSFSDKKGDDFLKSILSTYETVNFQNLKFLNAEKSLQNFPDVKIDNEEREKVLNWLSVRCDALLSDLNDDTYQPTDCFKNICDSLHLSEVVFYFLSFLKGLNLSSKENDDLLFQVQNLVLLAGTKAKQLLIDKQGAVNVAPFSNFYSCDFDPYFCERIRTLEFTNLSFLKIIFEKLFMQFGSSFFDDLGEEIIGRSGTSSNLVFKSPFNELIDVKSPLHENKFTEKEACIINGADLLCQFLVTTGSVEPNQYQTALTLKITEALCSYEIKSSTSYFQYHMILRILYSLTKCSGISLDILKNSLSLLTNVYQTKRSDTDISFVILELFKETIPLIHRTDDGDIREKYLKLIDDYDTEIRKKSCGPKVVLKFVECLTEMAKIDINGTWAVNDARERLFEDLVRYLKYPCNEVRLLAAQSVGILFAIPKNVTDSLLYWQKKMLGFMFDTLTSASCKDSPNEYSKVVMASASLIAWANVICTAPYWRKPSLFFMLDLIFTNRVSKDQAMEISRVINEALKIRQSDALISRNFQYLFHKWIEKEYAMEDFPFYLLGFGVANEFYSKYLKEIASVYLINGQQTALKNLCLKYNENLTVIVGKCSPELLAFILPYTNENIGGNNIRIVQEIKLLVADLTHTVFEEKLEQVISVTMKNFNDREYFKKLCDSIVNIEEEKSRSSYNMKEIKQSFQNLSPSDESLLGYISTEKPSVIQKVLFYLSKEIWSEVTYEDKIMSLCKYLAFVEMISGETNENPAYRRFNVFFIREVVNTLASVIRKDESEDLTVMACRFLKSFSGIYLEKFSSTFGEFLPLITSALVPLMKNRHRDAGNAFNFIVRENYHKLKEEISLLDPLPCEEIFSEANSFVVKSRDDVTSLKGEIQRFLNAGKSKNSGCRLEGLRHLHALLSDRKDELKEMYEDLSRIRGFSEDCTQSLIHQLIYMLVELSFEKNSEIKSETAKCLGELGPVDLTTLVLKPKNDSADSKEYVRPFNRLVKSSLIHLSNLIVEDGEVKIRAAETVQILLSTLDGNKIVDGKELPAKTVDYLTPFRHLGEKSLRLSHNEENFLKNVDVPDLWVPKTHEVWIRDLVKALLESLEDEVGLIPAFRNLVDVRWEFAESIFPVLIDLLLSIKKDVYKKVISQYVNKFFKGHIDSERKDDQKSVQCMVNMVDYVRVQRNYEGIYNKFNFDVNYFYIAKAALDCSAFFTAILYAELWYEEKKLQDPELDVDRLGEKYPEEGRLVADVLRECYSSIGIPDGILGCGYDHLLDPASEIQQYQHMKKWNLSSLHHDILISQNPGRSKSGLVNSLLKSGMLYTAKSLMTSSEIEKDLEPLRYKCAMRLGDWSQIDARKNEANLEKCEYFALKAFRDEDFVTFYNKIDKARDCVTSTLTSCSLECSKNVYGPLASLRCAKEFEDFARAVQKENVFELEMLYRKWSSQDEVKDSEFKLTEAIASQRSIILKTESEKNKNPRVQTYLKSVLCEVYLKLIKNARQEKQYEIAARNIAHLNELENVPENIVAEAKIEKARISWEVGEKNVGKFLLSRLLEGNEIRGESKAECLRLYGDWMAETRSENSQQILENYYFKALSESSDKNVRVDTYASLAKFAYYNYQQLKEYLSSPLFEIKQDLITTQQTLATVLQSSNEVDADKKRAAFLAKRQCAIDENEINNAVRDKDDFMNLALKYYLLVLKEGEKYDLSIFRVVSLWLSNPESKELTEKLKEMLPQIPTYKFLCTLPQIMPRMAKMELIESLIARTLQDHPYHTLPLLFALEKSLEDEKYMNKNVKTTPDNERSIAAKKLLAKCQRTNQKLKNPISEMRSFCSALIQFAHLTPDKNVKIGTPIDVPRNLEMTGLNLNSIVVPTLNLPYRKNCNYDDVIKLRSFDRFYENVGGVNAPKKIQCTGTDGIKRTLLIKGKDDLRQDAVMQQVFTIMNSLLLQNAETKKRKLIIRTYKVVPLSQRSGIIEWCENTQPLSIYLIGKNSQSGAHAKFNPKDLMANECRMRLRNLAERRASNKEKLKGYLEICKNFRPVFHYYFTENFASAGMWFERRLAYTLSVAASSMIGYILGIGDRHVHNILIDNVTAEMIHIDLGIAFDQGKSLPTPEMVPFRLSRDIVDGMGLSGVEGVFRIACIKTMEVLRNNQDTILTLLEVLLYDPLYAWTLTPEKAKAKQSENKASASVSTEKYSPDVEVNRMAERALINLRQKLQGTEGGVPTEVEGQVNYLIQQARDPNNLCKMFHGWQAYL